MRGGAVPPPAGFVLNTANREEVRAFYNAVYASTEGKQIAWTGNATTGVAGTTDPAFREAVRLRINCFRAMAGVSAGVLFSEALHPSCQQAALMMSANNDLSHTPPTTWTFYTPEGAQAAGDSNLSLGDYGPEAISSYMEDAGAVNAPVGHRRWFLFPQTQTMATGDVTGSGALLGANAVVVFDSHISDPRPTVRDEFVAWPPPGYVPHTLLYPRWSFSFPGADFSATTVTLSKNGANLPVMKEVIEGGYGEETLVWVPQGLDSNDWEPGPAPVQDEVYTVALNGVKLGAQTRNFTYTVRAFDAAKAGGDTVEATISGPQTANIGAAAQFSCVAVPRATGYDWQFTGVSAAPATEGAEGGLANIAQRVSGYNVLANVGASGARSFHLTMLDTESQWFELVPTYLPRAGATLRFKSRLGYSGAGQTARVQLSRDEGLTWNDAFTQSGTNTAGEANFVSRSIALGAYAERSLRVRFRYDYRAGGTGFFEPDEDVGWLVDDIAFFSTDTLGSTTTTRTGATFPRTLSTAGSFVARVRPVFYDTFPGEWAPVYRVAVTQPLGTLVLTAVPPEGGTISGGTSPVQGTTVSLQAVPASGYFFTGWSGGLVSESATLNFTMPASLTLNASFVLNPFPAGAGKYFGVVAATPSAHAGAGIVSITVSATGAFTGKVQLGEKTTRFIGKLSPTGVAKFDTGGSATLNLPQAFAFTAALSGNNIGTIAGTLDGAPFAADRRSLSISPASVGAYTARLSAAAPASGAWPEGDGWARIQVSATAAVTLTATLADGTPITAGGWLGSDGRWPIYIPLSGGKGSLSGISALANLTASDITAPLRWFRPASGNARFPAGWPQGLDCTLSGAHYTPPVPPARVFSALDSSNGEGRVRAELHPPFDWPVLIAPTSSKVTVASGSTDRSLITSLTPKTGVFSATFRAPANGRAYQAKGVVIQKEQLATGFALKPAGSIRVRLESEP